MNWLSNWLGLSVDFGSILMIKSWAFFGALIFSSILQFIWPFKNSWRANIQNGKINFVFGFFNAVLVGAVIGSTWYGLADLVAIKKWGLLSNVTAPLYLQIAVTIFALDLLTYAWHRLNHNSKILWAFHQVHHSDLTFDVSTAVRFHFCEILISLLARMAITLLLGLPVMGILIFEVIYHIANTFQHGDIRLPLKFEKLMSRVFITPALHRLHHSQLERDLNKNFSTIFSFWDKIFSSFKYCDSKTQFLVGLPDQRRDYGTFKLFRMPFEKTNSES